MRRLGILFTLVVLCEVPLARGQEANAWRYLNGAPVKYEIARVTPAGVEVRNGAADRVLPWAVFSPATRFRYDPLYRANLGLAQQGLDVRAWTNEADGGYVVNPVPLRTELPVAADAAPLMLAGFPAPKPQPRAGLAGLDLRNGARALTWGFQFGPGPSDVVYFVFDPAGPDGLPSAVQVWTDPAKRPEALRGSRRSDGDETSVLFRKQRFQSRIEKAAVQFDLGLQVSTRDPGALFVTLDVELTQGAARSSFTLMGRPPGVLVGDGSVVARDLLSPPALRLSVELTEGKPALVGSVRMGRLALLPGASMQKGINVTITDGRGVRAVDELALIQEDRTKSVASIFLPLDRLAAGQKYALAASIDLGPFLGSLRYEESFVRP